MNGKQLKNSILKLAIQGKLVPQDSSDEPASVLLSRIREEKQRLVDEKIIKKEKALAPITEEEKPFDIPESWEWVRLGEIGDWGAGATPAKGNMSYYNNGTIPWLRTGDLNNATIKNVEMRITEKALSECSLRICNIGDVLIAMYGATIGKVAIAGIKLTTNQACCACTPLCLYNKYLFYFLQANKDVFIKMGAGGAQPNISREKIINTLFPLPSLAEQHRIVAKIEELLPLVEEYDEAQKKLDKLNDGLPEKLKKSVLQQAIMGRLGTQNDKDEPASELLKRIKDEKTKLIKEKKIKKEKVLATITDDEKPFDIPESWEWVRLGEICTFLSRGRSPKYTEKSDIPVFAQKCNLKEGGISLDNAKFLDPNTLKSWNDIYKILEGDVLLNSTGTGTVGRTRLFKNEYLGKYSFTIPDSHVTIVRTSDSIMSDYVFYVLSSFTIQKYFEDNLAGSTNQKELYINIVHDLCFPLPPLAEQHRIVTKIEELLTMIERIKLK